MECVAEHLASAGATPRWGMVKGSAFRLASALCLLFSFRYVFFILPSAAAVTGPGVVPDLYPAWYASRAVWQHHQDPYSPEITRQIQAAMWQGRRPSSNQQRFAYPIFAVLLLAPFAVLPFATAQVCFATLSALLTGFAVRAWLGNAVSPPVRTLSVILAIASFPVMLGIRLCQPTLLVAALLAGAFRSLSSARLVTAGVLGALACVKPQLAIGVLLPIGLWAISDWRRRKSFLIALGLTLAALLGASHWLSHGWLLRWLATVRAYASYAGAKPLVCVLPGVYLPVIAGTLLVGASIAVSWKWGRSDLLLAIVFSACVFQFVMPFHLYDEVMLLPAALWAAARGRPSTEKVQLLLYGGVWGLLSLAWFSTAAVCIAHIVSPALVASLWSAPLVIAWIFPFALLGYLAVCASASISATVIPIRRNGPEKLMLQAL